MTDWKLTDGTKRTKNDGLTDIYGPEFAGLENDGQVDYGIR